MFSPLSPPSSSSQQTLSINPITSQLANVVKSLTSSELEAMKYLCTGVVPAEKVIDVKSASGLLSILEQYNQINPATGSVKLLIDLLETPGVGRRDLARELSKTATEMAATLEKQKCEEDRKKLLGALFMFMPEKEELLANWKHGEWEIKQRLAVGDSSVVFKGKKLRKTFNPIGFGFSLQPPSNVAVKILAKRKATANRHLFLHQADVLQSLHQDANSDVIVSVIATLSTTTPPALVFELAPHGDLNNYLKKMKRDSQQLATSRLLSFASQIPDGMFFLEEKQCVHCNLQASNILLFDNDIIKIGGFSMARLYADRIEDDNDDTSPPVRWSAPEVVLYRHFSHKSDVWSFGILLIELFSNGALPYQDMNNEAVLTNVQRNYRHPMPESCPQRLYNDVMMKCWLTKPDERPSSKELKEAIENLHQPARKLVMRPSTSSVYPLEPTVLRRTPSADSASTSSVVTPLIRNSGPAKRYTHIKSMYCLSRDSIELLEEIGSGQFGKVQKARLNGTDLVAVKIIRIRDQKLDKTMEEVDALATLKHDNIVRLIGMCLPADGPEDNRQTYLETVWIITELVECGNLKNYLITGGKESIDILQLTSYAIQIADAMTYVESRKFIHRDIAARNVLVADEGRIVKLSDFGLSRRIQDSEYYSATSDIPLPVRWMSPEAVRQRKFSIYSDVWSFAVLLVEIYSYGVTPYAAMDPMESLEEVEKGMRHPKPDACPEQVYELMLQCWNSVPFSRPSFKNIHEKLLSIGKSNNRKFAVPSEYLHP